MKKINLRELYPDVYTCLLYTSSNPNKEKGQKGSSKERLVMIL